MKNLFGKWIASGLVAFWLLTLASCGSEEKLSQPCSAYVSMSASTKEIVEGGQVTFTNSSREDTIKLSLGLGKEEPAAEEGDEGDEEVEEAGSRLFFWDFGDGTVDSSGKTAIDHTFEKPGTYKVRLVYPNCGEVLTEITVAEKPKDQTCITPAKIIASAPKDGKKYRVGEELVFSENSECGHTWEWYGAGEVGVIGREKTLKKTFKFPEENVKIWVKINPGEKNMQSPEIEFSVAKNPVVVPPPPAPKPSGPTAGKTPPPPPAPKPCKPANPKLESQMKTLLVAFVDNPAVADQIKALCISSGFQTKDKIVDWRGSTQSLAYVRADIENDKYKVKEVKVTYNKQDCSVERISIQ